MKNVYYETDADRGTVEKLVLESKNFTQYRSIESQLQEAYPQAEKFSCFTPIAVRQLEGELFTKANEYTNKFIEVIQGLNKFETELLVKYGLPQCVYSISGQMAFPEEIWRRIEDFQK